jgi:hypothetical protein
VWDVYGEGVVELWVMWDGQGGELGEGGGPCEMEG